MTPGMANLQHYKESRNPHMRVMNIHLSIILTQYVQAKLTQDVTWLFSKFHQNLVLSFHTIRGWEPVYGWTCLYVSQASC